MRVGKLVQWTVFEPLIHGALPSQPKGPGGRPRFHPMLMFKVLVLQRLHGLADDATSFQITDRNSFRAFLGLTPGDAVPDGQTVSDFRELLIQTKTFESLFDAFLAHLQKEHGLALAKEGVMVDASFAEVPKQRNSREDNALIKAGEVPPTLQDNPKVKAHKDLDARWTKKNNETHYGYKDHVKVDVQDKLILKAVITAANVHDSQALDELIEEGDRVVYADSAYSGAPIEAALAVKKVEPQINEKGTRGNPLSEEQKANNREKSSTRSRVEHVFAQMSGSMKALYQRCIGMRRNAACLMLTNLVYNMLRFEQIKRLKLNAAA
jgi:IS5 family transposase